MSFNTIMEFMTPDRFVALLIICACVSAIVAIAKSVLRVVLTAVSMMAVIYFFDPSLYSFLIDFIKSSISYAARLPQLLGFIRS